MEVWYDEAIREVGNDGGSYTDNGEPKGLLHTTEGKTYAGAKAAYRVNDSWPHFTVTFESGFFRCFQHNPIDIASRALRNLAGGVQTNRDRIIQIEMVGTADVGNKITWGKQYVENFPKEYLNGIGRLMRWCEKQLGIPRRCTLKFLPYPTSAGNSPVRLSPGAFDLYSGWMGHQHAAENVHGDPGLIDMTYLLRVDAPPAPTTDWFEMATKEELTEVVSKVTAARLMQGWDGSKWIGPSYYVSNDFTSKFHMDGWDNVQLAVNLGRLIANGVESGHPKPFPMDPGFLKTIPTTPTA